MFPTTTTPTDHATTNAATTKAVLTDSLNTSISAQSTEAETESGMVLCHSNFVNGTNDTITIISVREMTAWSVAAAATVLFIGSLIINVVLVCKKRQIKSKVKDPANIVNNVEPHIYDIADPPCSNDLQKINVKGGPVYENMKQKRYQ